jgi:16S rRNA G966 N2-methylase RsmD
MEMKKNSYQKKSLLFPPIESDHIQSIRVDKESYRYITPYKTALETVEIIESHIKSIIIPRLGETTSIDQLVITDMTAGVGGNCIPFAQHFKYVNAIDIDPTRVRYLGFNNNLYGLKNMNIYLGDSVSMLLDDDMIRQDIIFIDPPWGGDSYKEQTNMRLQLGTKDIEDIVSQIFLQGKAVLVCIKLPTNYDFEYLRSKFNNVVLHEQRKMYLVLIS